MMSSPAIRQRLTACIAIVAVLLLFVAPVVSKTLQERQHHPHSMMAGMSMTHHDAMPDMVMPGMDHHMMDDGEFACGYCDLLVHVPLMIWVFIPFIWLMLLISRAPPPPVSIIPVIRRYVGIHRPRAPPAIFFC